MKRREVLKLTVIAAPLLACGGGSAPSFSCDDTSRFDEAARNARRAVEYTDVSVQPDRRCSNCRYYTPAPSGQCGACQMVRGSIHPDGYCNLWTGRG